MLNVMFTLKNKQGTGKPDNMITTKRKIDNRNNQKIQIIELLEIDLNIFKAVKDKIKNIGRGLPSWHSG